MSGELIDSVRELARRVERLESLISKLDPQEINQAQISDYGSVRTNQTMTKSALIKKQARETIRHLKALRKRIDTLVTGKPAPKVRPKRKKSVKRKPVARKREKRPEDYDEALWDFVAN